MAGVTGRLAARTVARSRRRWPAASPRCAPAGRPGPNRATARATRRRSPRRHGQPIAEPLAVVRPADAERRAPPSRPRGPRGRSLTSIARLFGTTARSIAYWNRDRYPSLDPDSDDVRAGPDRVGWTLRLIPTAVVDRGRAARTHVDARVANAGPGPIAQRRRQPRLSRGRYRVVDAAPRPRTSADRRHGRGGRRRCGRRDREPEARPLRGGGRATGRQPDRARRDVHRRPSGPPHSRPWTACC